MLRMKYAIGSAFVLAVVLLPAGAAICATPAADDVQWDDVDRPSMELAFMEDKDVGPDGRMGGPPGPPHHGDAHRRPPTRGGRYNDRGPTKAVGMMRPGMARGFGKGMPGDPEMLELMKKDKQLDRESRHLAAQYKDASEERRSEIKLEVMEIVSDQFDVRQVRRALELQRLEEQLKDLRQAVAKREQARQELIDRRISHLLQLEPEF